MPGLVRSENRSTGVNLLRHGGRIAGVNRGEGSAAVVDPVRAAILATASAETLAHVLAVESADGQEMENAVLEARVDFANYRIPLGGACCLMAGARTLAGALVPLVGEAPTNVGDLFQAGDYSRVTGLQSNGSTKYLDTNRSFTADAQDDCHVAVRSSSASGSTIAMGNLDSGATAGQTQVQLTNPFQGRMRANATDSSGLLSATPPGFAGFSRASSTEYTAQVNADSNVVTRASAAFDGTGNYSVFRQRTSHGNLRLAMYSIGAATDLGVMNTNITTCMNAIAAALP